MSVFIHTREPGAYILRVIGCGRFDFLFQVRDEERLLYWYSLFDNNRQPPSSNHWSASMNDDGGVTMPLGNLSMNNLSMNNLSLMNGLSLAPPSPSHQAGGQQQQGLGSGLNPRSESDQTLHGDLPLARYNNSGISSSNNNGTDESMGFSQVSSNYFNSMLNSHQQYPPQSQQQQGSSGEVTESQSLRGQQSVVDLGTLSRVVVPENDGAGSGQQQYERRYF